LAPESAAPRAGTRGVVGTTGIVDIGSIFSRDPHVNPYLARGYLDSAAEIAWLMERSECATRQALADTPMAPAERTEDDS
jgi:hypothetical protein